MAASDEALMGERVKDLLTEDVDDPRTINAKAHTMRREESIVNCHGACIV
jgi:hypothetical protein